MPTFFHGWRRKAGCITLLMALAFMSAWVRSFYVEDTILVQWGTKTIFTFVSEDGSASWCVSERMFHPRPEAKYIDWISRKREKDFTFLDLSMLLGIPERKHELHYLTLAIPMLMLSAYLLLSKPRKATETKASEHTPSFQSHFIPNVFPGWRCIAGCVMFVMAFMFVAGWVRSYRLLDAIQFQSTAFESKNGAVLIVKRPEPDFIKYGWTIYDGIKCDSDLLLWYGQLFSREELRRDGFELSVVPYWAIAIPMTLLSIYLLISKPRKAIQTPATEPPPEKLPN